MENLSYFLKKYDVPGPRYTSYPTVPAWKSSVSAADYQKALTMVKQNDVLSLYFHLPFCENLCHFCGCMQVITKDKSKSKEYVDHLLTEIDTVVSFLPKRQKVSQIHFGGGTPNFIQPSELESIIQKIREVFDVQMDCEIAIEMHPRTATNEFCRILPELGFNRISLGVQDLDPNVQKLINRNQTYEMTVNMMHELRSLGLKSFNMDLVYGLPGQTKEGWKDTLTKVIDLKPNRLAVYSYAHVPWVRPVQRTFSEKDLPTPEQKIYFFEMALNAFLDHGYDLIGMDHFALKDDELSLALKNKTIHRNFMGYSTQSEAHQIGFGVSSISYVSGHYFQNAKDLKSYYSKVEQKEVATYRGYWLLTDDAIRRDLISRIMCLGYVDVREFELKWQLSFADYFAQSLRGLETFVEDELLVINSQLLQVKDKGFLFLRNIAMNFDAHLMLIQANAKTPTFSRTV